MLSLMNFRFAGYSGAAIFASSTWMWGVWGKEEEEEEEDAGVGSRRT